MGSFKTNGKSLIIVFIGVLVAATIIGMIADQTSSLTSILTVTNETVTPSAVNVTLDVQGRTLVTTVAIVNSTNGTMSLVNLGGVLQTATGSGGLRTVQLLLNDTAANHVGTGYVNISYTAEPDGYLPTSSARSMTLLIPLFAALGILIFSLLAILSPGVMDKFIKFKGAR